MARLRSLVIADPVADTAQLIADESERLAEGRAVATTGQDALRLVQERNPEMLVLSLELQKPDAETVAAQLAQSRPELFIVATYRELSVKAMDKLGKRGIDDFVAQPIDFTLLFRAASARFGRYFRRHDRYRAELEVVRADGVSLGKTRDLSEGGMSLIATTAIEADHSFLVDLDAGGAKVRVRFHVLAVEGAAPQLVARGMFENLRAAELKRLRTHLATLTPIDD